MEGTYSKQNSNIEEIFFEIEPLSIDEIQKGIQAISPPESESPRFSFPKKEPRFHDYIIKSEEMLTLTSFEDNALNFIFEEETSLKIKDSKSSSIVSDQDLMKLEKTSNKLRAFNQAQETKEPDSLWKRMHERISGLFKPVKKIPKHLRITKLMVNLNNCGEVGDDGLKFLIDFIKNFENLTYLEFEVKNTGATDYCVGMICSLLGALKNLTYFYIDFSGCKVTDESIFYLASTLKTKVNLEEIWLRFSWCQNDVISNEALQTLSKSLELCKKLRVLLLEFNGQTQISSKGASGILNSIKGRKSLQRLYLYFEKSQVNDNFVNFAGKVLPKLKKLEVFGLNLAHSNFLTTKSLENLSQGLNSLGRLKTGLYLYLNGCFGVMEKEGIKKSINKLVKKKKIKNSVIEFE